MISLQAFTAIIEQLPALSDRMGVFPQDRERVFFRNLGATEMVNGGYPPIGAIVVSVGEAHTREYEAVFDMTGSRLLSLCTVRWDNDGEIRKTPHTF